MRSAGVGTLAWGRRTGGRLAFADRLALLAQAVALQAEVSGLLRRRAGLRPGAAPQPPFSPTAPAPDTPTARRAEAWCREASSPSLVNHCLRTFAWGRLLAVRDGIAFDEEAFYVTCLLHDLGLTPGAAPAGGAVCFAVSGAVAARDALVGAGWSSDRAGLVADAICLHLNVRVGLRHGPLAYLLRAGSGLDVIGARYRALPPAAVAAVLAAHPRLGFKRELNAAVDRHAMRPGSRAEFLSRWLGFRRMIAAAPFDE